MSWKRMEVLNRWQEVFVYTESTTIAGNQQHMSILTKPFTLEALEEGLTTMKRGKAAGPDDILTEMITQLGPAAKQSFAKNV